MASTRTIYDIVAADFVAWCSANAFEIRSEFATVEDGIAPERYVIFHVTGQAEGGFYDNAPSYTDYSLQTEITLRDTSENRAAIPGLRDSFEAYIKALGYRLSSPSRQYADGYETYTQRTYTRRVATNGD